MAARSVARCDDAIARPSDYADGQYQGFRWVEALSACLVARAITGSDAHTDAAKLYLNALLDDLGVSGPRSYCYPDGSHDPAAVAEVGGAFARAFTVEPGAIAPGCARAAP